MKDLFGDDVDFEKLPTLKQSPLKGIKRKTGYAYPPGTGPEGETCKSCKHKRRFCSGKKGWYKCGLVGIKGHLATDIKLRSPACLLWEAQ